MVGGLVQNIGISLAFVTQAATNASHFCCWCICTPNEATKAQLKNSLYSPKARLEIAGNMGVNRGNEMHTLLPSQGKTSEIPITVVTPN